MSIDVYPLMGDPKCPRARHAGPADWDRLAEARRALRIPVIGNGGIRTPEDAAARLRNSGVAAVMIGRGALGNPWLFAQCRAELTGERGPPPTLEERCAAQGSGEN